MENEVKEKEVNNKINKKKYIILIVLIVLMIIATIAVSTYAFFTLTGNKGNDNVITSGSMSLHFTDGSAITANGMVPGQHVDKTFTVENTGTVAATYDVYLSDVINNFADQTDLVYEIISNDGGYNTSSPAQRQVPNAPTKIISNHPIGVDETHTYTLRITFLNKDENQNDNQGKMFSAKIRINDYSYATAPASSIGFDNTTSNILDSNNQPVTNVQDALDAISDLLS